MRRREAPAPVVGKLPPEFALGRCVEVWGAESSAHVDPASPWASSLPAFSRFTKGRRAYAESIGLVPQTPAYTLLMRGVGSPWSIAFMIANGKADEVEERFRSAGVTMSDIPRLQRAAQLWVQMKEAGHDSRP